VASHVGDVSGAKTETEERNGAENGTADYLELSA